MQDLRRNVMRSVKINKKESIYDYRYEDIIIENYKSHENIKVDVAI